MMTWPSGEVNVAPGSVSLVNSRPGLGAPAGAPAQKPNSTAKTATSIQLAAMTLSCCQFGHWTGQAYPRFIAAIDQGAVWWNGQGSRLARDNGEPQRRSAFPGAVD